MDARYKLGLTGTRSAATARSCGACTSSWTMWPHLLVLVLTQRCARKKVVTIRRPRRSGQRQAEARATAA